MLGFAPVANYQLEFYEDENGDSPVRRWLKDGLTTRKRRVLGTAMNRILQRLGVGVCGTEYGKQLGGGLFEFRVRGREVAKFVPLAEPGDGAEAKLLLRVFCHAYGERIVLLLAGYDKGESPSRGRQGAEIALARKRLTVWQQRHRRGSG